MYILGISAYYHDAAAALLRDGVLVAAAEEERFSRRKHDHSFPQRAIDFCMERAGITARDLDYAVFYEKPLPKFERILLTSLQTWPRSWRAFPEAMITWLTEKLHIRAQIVEALDLEPEQVLFSEHHISHAASAFFCSPFDEAAVMTADGVGEWTTAAIGVGQASWGEGRNELVLTHETRFPHSLGLFYSAFTAFLGFEVNDGEYKVMGMAPYGDPKYVDRVEKVIRCESDGSFWLDMDYFAFHYSREDTIGPKFLRLFGEPRRPEADFYTPVTHPERASDAGARQNQYYSDLAASVQAVIETVLLKMAGHLRRTTGQKRLCFAGGVAYNSAANGRLVREAPFEEVYIQPAAGDSGGALGAALYAYHVLLGKPRAFVMEHSYWGAGYREAQIVQAMREAGATYQRFDDETQLADRVAAELTEGKVVGWFQGRSEWGPRALGHRSILADPRRAEMKDVVNTKIKFREPFRPFAPAVLSERVNDLFELPAAASHPARFMLAVMPVRANQRDAIPAVTHADGSARLQAVHKQASPAFHDLIGRFCQATGVPVLLNTSFNLRGEPIVNSPADALSTFRRSGLDVLVLGNFLLKQNSRQEA
jgi:carbamoyltransferase